MTLIDSYPESNYSNYDYFIYASYPHVGQCLELGSTNYKLINVYFWVYRDGNPTGSVYSKIWNATGTAPNMTPTGDCIAESTAKDVTKLPGAVDDAVAQNFAFSGDNQIVLNAGGKYYIACCYNGGDSSNRLRFCVDNTSPTHPGNFYQEPAGVIDGVDGIFYLWGASLAVDVSTLDASDITTASAKLHGNVSYPDEDPGITNYGFDYTDEQGNWKWST
jgi:hypothetical protein